MGPQLFHQFLVLMLDERNINSSNSEGVTRKIGLIMGSCLQFIDGVGISLYAST